ncbi:MAG: endonuclease V [Pseudomonadota bacterium]|nr:endonuclease V [Pseudomonadota bacterium]
MGKQVINHPWQLFYGEAVVLQRQLRERVIVADQDNWPPETVAGADISYDRRHNMLFAAVLIFSYPDLTLMAVEQQSAVASFPYIPGLLTFREGPLLAEILHRCPRLPDLLVCDGQGIAHPRGLGLAAHLGVLFDLPTIGCAKTKLVGEYKLPGLEKGAMSPLRKTTGELFGMVVRTRERVKPVFVSPGHLISVKRAAMMVLKLSTRYRLPEVTRQAHQYVNRMRKKWLAEIERPVPSA